jgi:hypothetical protein
VGMAKRRTTLTPEREAILAARRAAREADREAGLLGKRRKAGQMAGPTKANASKNACRSKHNRGGWRD